MPLNKKIILVGTGIKSVSHITKETEQCVKKADMVLYLVNEPILKEWIDSVSKESTSLESIYFSENDRKQVYSKISRFMINTLDSYNHVCVVFYGHPTVFVESGLMALKEIEKKGIEAVVLPAISTEDCLFADMKMDPSDGGCFSIDATEFLVKEKKIDVTSHLVLWQVGMICRSGLPTNEVNTDGLIKLQHKLNYLYSTNAEAFIYEAALYPGVRPSITKSSIDKLHLENITTISTLYIPPISKRQ